MLNFQEFWARRFRQARVSLPRRRLSNAEPQGTGFYGAPNMSPHLSPNRAQAIASASVSAWFSGEKMTLLWWSGLCAVSVLNVGLWLAAIRVELPDTQYRVWQLVLSGIYVAVCAFRAAFPRVDLERLCLWETRLSSIFAGRFAATVAEMCFAVQCTLLLTKLSEITGLGYLGALALWIVPAILLAQLLCWYAVVSLNNLGHVIEELLWAWVAVLLAVGLTGYWLHADGALRIVTAIGIACCAGTALLICLIDVPMYVSRWYHSQRAAPGLLPLRRGLHDTVTRRHPTRNWRVWRREVPWMTLYFSVGVWLSIGMTLLEALAP